MRRSLATSTLVSLALACADDGSSNHDEVGDASSSSSSEAGSSSASESGESSDADTTSDASSETDSTTGEAPPHVVIEDGATRIDGQPTFLFGGELQYFRVRDESFDADATHAMWANALDRMVEAGMNLVTFYVPWDYHSPAPGEYDFTGARDVGRFLDMACERGLYVIYKPGPLITAEWPRGFGTFGAVPTWFKEQHPEALVLDAGGNPWSYSPSAEADQRQPTYLHPAYLDAVREWYEVALPIALPHIDDCVIGIQIDNETNLYWGDRYGQVDYSEPALAHYREFLAQKYGDIAALNLRYQSSHADFAEVMPPTAAPGPGDGVADNPWFADWYEAGHAYSGEYLATLQQMVVDAGFAPPDVLHLTNDSPFAMQLGDILLRNVLIHDGPTKNAIAPTGLDLYPKQFNNASLQDQPFQADYHTQLYDHYNDLATGPQSWVFGAELQGGFYEFPLLGQPLVRPQATDQLLARTIGRGLKGGSFYVIHDGLNLDDSEYDYAAGLDMQGQPTPRWTVQAKWAAMLAEHQQLVLTAEPVHDSIAILTDGRYAAPQAGLLDDMQRLYSIEQPAVFGWLAHAGFFPAVLDARTTSLDTLAQYDAVVFQNPDFVDDQTAELLADYVDAGGLLINLLWPGGRNRDFVPSAATSVLGEVLFPAAESGYWLWVGPQREGPINVELAGMDDELMSYWYATFWADPGDPALAFEPFAWEHTEPLGFDGDWVGYALDDAEGHRVFLGANVWARFNQAGYYDDMTPSELAKSRTLARELLARAGLAPKVAAADVHQLAWARRSGEHLLVFVINDDADDALVEVDISPDAGFELAGHTAIDAFSGAAIPLDASGFSVAVAGWSATLVIVSP